VAALILLLAAVIVCGRAGILKVTRSWMHVFRVGIWVLVAQMALNTMANLASSSAWERYLMSGLTLTLGILCLGVAISFGRAVLTLLKLDEKVPASLQERLRALGHDVDTVHAEQLQAEQLSDNEAMNVALEAQRAAKSAGRSPGRVVRGRSRS
jgi:hypothetical protein